jgi:hypothetical protein
MTRPVAFGVILGSLLGAWILVSTLVSPLADDTAAGVGTMFGVVLLALMVPGFSSRRRGGRFGDAVAAGAAAGAITFALFLVFGILRVNLFLETIRNRSDWQNLVADYSRSGFHSLRAYANYVYAKGILAIPAAGLVAGAVCSSLGGLVANFARPQTSA